MKKIYSFLLLTAFMLVGGLLPVMAQYTVVKTIDVYHEELEKVAFSENREEVDVASICEALGISNITEASYKCAIPNGENNYTYEDETADGWRDPITTKQAPWYTEKSICTKVWDEQKKTAGNITYIGCIDDTHLAGESYTFPWAIVKDDKAVIINVNITFVTAPIYTPTEILETYTISYEAPEKKAGDLSYSLPIENDILESVKSQLNIDDFSTCTTWIVNTDDSFVANTTDGWRDGAGNASLWGTAVDGVCAKLDLIGGRYNYIGTYGGEGWENGLHEAGTEYHARWGVVNSEDKAVVLDLVITFVAPPITSLADLTGGEKGSLDIAVDRKVVDESISTGITIDVDAVANDLGCEVSSLKLYAENAEGITNGSTANNQGFWLDKEGKAINWPNGAIFFEPDNYGDFSAIHIGQDNNVFSDATVWTAKLYLVNEDGLNYYTINVTITINASSATYTNDQTILPSRLGNGATVTLEDRTFAEGWNTLVLPFDITAEQMKDVLGVDKVELATFAGAEDDIVKFSHAEEVLANTPCLIYVSEAKSGPFTFTNVDIDEVVANPAVEGIQFDFVGSYVATAVEGGNYILTSGNQFMQTNDKGNALKSCRAYLKANQGNAAKTLSVRFDMNDTVTGIQAIDGVSTDGSWYTISGQLLNAAPATRGIYIKDGKKVIVK